MSVQGELFGVGLTSPAPPELELADLGQVEQLALLHLPAGSDRGRAGAVPSSVWKQLLSHAPTRRRYQVKVHRRGDDQCWYWCGAISSTGHGKLKAGRATGASIVVTAHVYGWQMVNGPIRSRLGEDLVIAHTCDEASCQNPRHWELVPREVNGADYRLRRWRAEGPLADIRGAEGRAVAVREAIRIALAAGTDPVGVDAAIAGACAAGLVDIPSLF